MGGETRNFGEKFLRAKASSRYISIGGVIGRVLTRLTCFYIPKVNLKVTIWGQRSNYIAAITLKSTKANFINIHGQIRHHKRVCHAQNTGSHTQGQGQN